MGERKGTNKYYPPDFDPKKHKSLSGYTGAHPLRERARKLHKGILIIRFEMPYNIWCGGCNSHIGMGVRYNAEKSKIGKYYSTPIWKFRMKCHLCPNHFEIKTDPASHDYVIIEGARRKEQRWDPKENEQIVPEDRDTHKKIYTDAMYRLQHGSDDKAKMKKCSPTISQLEDLRSTYKDDYELNKLARDMFRTKKKEALSKEKDDQLLLEKASLDIPLLEMTEEDDRIANLLKYSTFVSFDVKREEMRKNIQNRPLFDSQDFPSCHSKYPAISKTSYSDFSSSKSMVSDLSIQNFVKIKKNEVKVDVKNEFISKTKISATHGVQDEMNLSNSNNDLENICDDENNCISTSSHQIVNTEGNNIESNINSTGSKSALNSLSFEYGSSDNSSENDET